MCGRPGTHFDPLEIHHIRARSSGKGHTDRDNLMRVHKSEHERLLTNPTREQREWALNLGYIKSRFG